MIDSFRPYMSVPRLAGYQLELREIGGAVTEGPSVAARLYGPSPAVAQRRLAASFPNFAAFEAQWRVIDPDMTAMMDTIRANLGNYEDVAALPSFTLFPWFFVIPGVILLALLGLARARPPAWRRARWAIVALGAGLVLAPVVFQMFSRAAAGGGMMTAFRSIETRARVVRIQGYFGEIADGQGAVQLQRIGALRRSGLNTSRLGADYPGLQTLDAQWVHILNDMTPMIGAMSGNVVNYQAVAALPPFPLFPWFFVAPGLLVAGLAIAAGPRGSRRARRTVQRSDQFPNRRSHMKNRSISRFGAGLAALAALAITAAPASAAQLKGLFRISTGSYFRMQEPSGGPAKYFSNPYSRNADKTYTLITAGTEGGLQAGSLQGVPNPAFDSKGNARAALIIKPTDFNGINFSLVTLNIAPDIVATAGRLSGQVTGLHAAWNKLLFKQGGKVSGTYNAQTHLYVLNWTSPVVGGPFNGFTGIWHLQGTFSS
jgi:hypothetical protein